MEDMNFMVCENGCPIACFVSQCAAETFIEEWRSDDVPMELVYIPTNEIINTWTNGVWEND